MRHTFTQKLQRALSMKLPTARNVNNTIHVSDLLGCVRDLYWRLTGVPETNPADDLSQHNFDIGNWVEAGLREAGFRRMHFDGIHYIDQNMLVTMQAHGFGIVGHVDVYMIDLERDQPIAVEVKTKHGYGATTLVEKREPQIEHVIQLGLYLMMLRESGRNAIGKLVYVLLSDREWGVKATFNVHVDQQNRLHVTAYEDNMGNQQPLGISANLNDTLNKLPVLKTALETGVAPPPTYQYNYPLTPEVLAATTKTDLMRAIRGEKTLGPWQPRYSRYRDLIIKTDNVRLTYTPAEISLLKAELAKRPARSRKVAKATGAEATIANLNEEIEE
jgi:hypothetical protein